MDNAGEPIGIGTLKVGEERWHLKSLVFQVVEEKTWQLVGRTTRPHGGTDFEEDFVEFFGTSSLPLKEDTLAGRFLEVDELEDVAAEFTLEREEGSLILGPDANLEILAVEGMTINLKLDLHTAEFDPWSGDGARTVRVYLLASALLSIEAPIRSFP